MRRFLIENYNIIKNAIGVEPIGQIFMNAIRKVIGLAPQHKSVVSSESIDLSLSQKSQRKFVYKKYLDTKASALKEKSTSFQSSATIDIVWILEKEEVSRLEDTFKDIENQYHTFENIFIVSESELQVGFSAVKVFSSLKHCLSTSESDYVCFMHGTPRIHAAYTQEILTMSEGESSVDVMYMCDDTILENGIRTAPQFKPQFNKFLLYSRNYIGKNIVVKGDFGRRINWFDNSYSSAYIYDFILRSMRVKANIKRVEEVLISFHAKEEEEDIRERKRALESYLRGQGDFVQVLDGIAANTTRLQRSISDDKVLSIIIPFKDQVGLLKQCIDSIIAQTKYQNYEIILVNNGSTEDETLTFLQEIKKRYSFIHLLHIDAPFNFSYLNNEAVKACNGEYLLFLNNDTKVITEGWLKAMVEELENEEVGAVGAKLLYADNTVQHAGVILGVGHVAGHAFRNVTDAGSEGKQRVNETQEYLAVTGACLLTKKKLFEAVDGFDEEHLQIAYNDVDYCLKIHDMGYKIIYTPHAKLYHYESKSRASDISKAEIERYTRECDFMHSKWKEKYYDDPFFHPHLDNRFENFETIKENA